MELNNFALLEFEGPDTRNFLQGQLSCDTEKLATGSWVWGGYLTPKGRLLATFVTLGLAEDKIGLLLDQSLIPVLETTLKRYLLRAKTKITTNPAKWGGSLDTKEAPNTVTSTPDNLTVNFNNMSMTTQPQDRKDNSAWWGHCVQQGYPWLSHELQEELTVHHASLDLIQGVDFDKGCYVGQEIVIRAHHRGAIKKRLYIATGTGTTPNNGTPLTSPTHNDQVIGNVLYAAPQDNNFTALISIRKDCEQIQLPNATITEFTPPPYGLIDPKFEQE